MILLSEGFENDVGCTHNVKVFPVGTDPYETQIGNIFVPKNWLFWFKHDPDTWDQPEAGYCWRVSDRHRIKEGNGAYKCFGMWRRMDAGLMRQFTVVPGHTLRLTAWAHAWSNHSLEGHEDCCDDGRCSCGVGRQEIAISAVDVPPLSGIPWNDAIGNSMFVVGIDPTGGTDPYSPNVVWGDPFAIYNGYVKELEVTAEARGSIATIFLRNSTLWTFKHNDAYWDQIKFTQEDTMLRGEPRIQYERLYVLLPPGADKEWASAVVDATWDKRRCTIGGSADDAGIGDLDSRLIIAINPSGWPGDLGAFFAEHYPGVVVSYITAATPDELRTKLEGYDPKAT